MHPAENLPDAFFYGGLFTAGTRLFLFIHLYRRFKPDHAARDGQRHQPHLAIGG
jgi:hypothetical protein